MIAYTGLLTNESYQTQVYEDLSPGEKRVYYYNYIRIPEWARLTHDETNDKDHITLKLQASISEKDNNGHYITSSPIEITIKRRSPTESELLKNTNLLFIPWYLSRPTYLVARVLHKPEDATKEPLDTIFDKVKIKYEKATGKKYDKPIPVVSQHSGNRVEWVYYHTKQPVMGELDILISNLSDSTLKNMYRLERIKLHFGARYASNQILSVRFGVECALDESEQEEQLTKLSEFFNSLNKLEAEYLALELKENMFFSPYVNEVMRKKFMNVVAEYLPRDFQ